jgi:hypothetical protein
MLTLVTVAAVGLGAVGVHATTGKTVEMPLSLRTGKLWQGYTADVVLGGATLQLEICTSCADVVVNPDCNDATVLANKALCEGSGNFPSASPATGDSVAYAQFNDATMQMLYQAPVTGSVSGSK